MFNKQFGTLWHTFSTIGEYINCHFVANNYRYTSTEFDPMANLHHAYVDPALDSDSIYYWGYIVSFRWRICTRLVLGS
jgi:hypothetical protein